MLHIWELLLYMILGIIIISVLLTLSLSLSLSQKMNHLEEVIDQKNDKISLLQKQIATLTAPPTEDEGSGGNTIDPGALKRQLLKMEQSMKVCVREREREWLNC